MLTRHSAPIIFFCVRSTITIAAGGIGVPIVLADNKEEYCVTSVRLVYFHTNCLLIELYKQETEKRCRKDDGFIKK